MIYIDVRHKNIIYFIGVYISIFISILCYTFNHDLFGVFFRVIMLLFLELYIFPKNNTKVIEFEKSIILLFILLFSILIYETRQTGTGVSNLLFCVAVFTYAIIYFTYNHWNINFRKWASENNVIFCIILVFIFLSIEVIKPLPMWDANVYYSQILEISKRVTSNSFSIYNLYLAGHASFGYSVWVILFYVLLGGGSASVQIADIVLASIGIFAYYQILRKLIGEKYSNRILSLATVIFAFSPYVLGMVGNISLDMPTMYLVIILIACSLYNYECLELIIATCFCFTKEPSIIYYFTYIIFKMICEFWSCNKFEIKKLLIFTIKNKKTYIYSLPVFFWLVLYVFNPSAGWGSSKTALVHEGILNSFGFNKVFILTKLKQVLFINFNWIFWLVIVFGVIYLVKKKSRVNKEFLKNIIPFIAFSFMVIIFGCLYVTWVHIRYMVPLIPGLYIISTLVIANFNRKFFCLWSILLGIILLIQSFYVIDPIMSFAFPSFTVGSYEIYSTQIDGSSGVYDEKAFHDSIVYNRQYLYWQEALEKTLNDARYNNDMLLVVPDGPYCTQYELFGAFEPSCLWNASSGHLVYIDRNKPIPANCVPAQIYSSSNVEEALGNDDILYIMPAWTNIDQYFISDKKIIKEGKINHKGYTLRYIILRTTDMEYELPLDEGNYTISPKQEHSLNIYTNGQQLLLGRNINTIRLKNKKDKYEILFDAYYAALDVPSNYVDSSGTVQVYPVNHTEAQKWTLEQIGEYYLICYKEYALTYNSEDDTIYLSKITREENQQWLFK